MKKEKCLTKKELNNIISDYIWKTILILVLAGSTYFLGSMIIGEIRYTACKVGVQAVNPGSYNGWELCHHLQFL